MTKRQPKYVSLEPKAFLSDFEFQAMTAEERGVYVTVIFSLYANKGRLRYDVNALRKLCNVNGEFSFQTVLSKFQVRRGYIYHKRVSQELKKAQVLVDRAVKAANARWDKDSTSNAQASDKQCQGKVSKGKVSKGKVSKDNNTPPISPPKKKYLEHVLLTDEEYKKLIVRLGEKDTQAYIEKLNNYIGSKGKRYKSHYYTILNWRSKDNGSGTQNIKSEPHRPGNRRDFEHQESQYGQTINI